jgi:hypothetical protein
VTCGLPKYTSTPPVAGLFSVQPNLARVRKEGATCCEARATRNCAGRLNLRRITTLAVRHGPIESLVVLRSSRATAFH